MGQGAWDIRADDLSGAATRDLVSLHLRGMHASSPPGSVFALDHSGLTTPAVCLWSAWAGERLAGICALKDLGVRGGVRGGEIN
jgi:putative acetyltransferase